MSSRYSFFGYLRPSFIIFFIVVWNLLCLVGIWLNGGMGRIRNFPSALYMATVCAGIAFVGFGSLAIPGLRALVLRPTVELSAARNGLIFMGLLGSFLAIGSVLGAISHL